MRGVCVGVGNIRLLITKVYVVYIISIVLKKIITISNNKDFFPFPPRFAYTPTPSLCAGAEHLHLTYTLPTPAFALHNWERVVV